MDSQQLHDAINDILASQMVEFLAERERSIVTWWAIRDDVGVQAIHVIASHELCGYGLANARIPT